MSFAVGHDSRPPVLLRALEGLTGFWDVFFRTTMTSLGAFLDRTYQGLGFPKHHFLILDNFAPTSKLQIRTKARWSTIFGTLDSITLKLSMMELYSIQQFWFFFPTKPLKHPNRVYIFVKINLIGWCVLSRSHSGSKFLIVGGSGMSSYKVIFDDKVLAQQGFYCNILAKDGGNCKIQSPAHLSTHTPQTKNHYST